MANKRLVDFQEKTSIIDNDLIYTADSSAAFREKKVKRSNFTLAQSQITGLTTASSPTFTGLTLSGLTASRLLSTDGSKALTSISDLTSWIAGTTNQISVDNDGDGSVTLSTPQNIATSSSPTFSALTLSSLTQNSILFAGTSGAISQNNSAFSWNNSTSFLTVNGTAVFGSTSVGTANYLFTRAGADNLFRIESTSSALENASPGNAILSLLSTTDWKISSNFTTGNLNIANDTATKLFIESTGSMGIGLGSSSTLNTSAFIDIQSDSSTKSSIFFTQFSGSSGTAPTGSFILRGARNTQASPSALLTNDTIGSLLARGYGASGFSSASRAAVTFSAAENWSDSAQGTYITFGTTPNTTATRATVGRISNAGNWYLGDNLNATSKVGIGGSLAVGVSYAEGSAAPTNGMIVQGYSSFGTAINTSIVDILVANVAVDNSSGDNATFIGASDNRAINKGGMLQLGGSRLTGAYQKATFASLSGRAENSTNSNNAGYLQFATSTSGGTVIEAARITSTQQFVIGGTDAATGAQLTIGSTSVPAYIDLMNSVGSTRAFIKAYTDGSGNVINQIGSAGGGNSVALCSANGNFLITASTTQSAAQFGNGLGCIFIANRTAAPDANATGGGTMYAESGAGKWRGSGGTTTTFGPAEPHCPVCNSDFGLEWENKKYGGNLQVCVKCLVQDLGDKPYVRWQEAA